jgi:uncharacterized RDD family membrane protein YckC
MVIVPASRRIRFLASLINYAPILLFIVIAGQGDKADGWGMGVFIFNILFLITQSTLYFARGQTVGKMLLGLNIYTYDSEKARADKLVLRLILGPLLSIVCFPYWFANYGLIIAKNKQCLHDRLTKTYVGMWRDESYLILKTSAEIMQTRRKWALAIDILIPVFVAALMLGIFMVIVAIWAVLGALTFGMLWFMWEHYFDEIPRILVFTGFTITILTYMYEAYLVAIRHTSIGKIICKVKA